MRRPVAASGSEQPGPGWACRHPPGHVGSFDESARRASHSELAVANLLTAEGHDVRTVAEARSRRTPDLAACGVTVEVKAFGTLEQRAGAIPRARQVANKLLVARGQGTVAVVWGQGSGLSEATARAGFDLFCHRAQEKGTGRLRSARVVGDGFDIALSPAERLQATQRLVPQGREGGPAGKPLSRPGVPKQGDKPGTAPRPVIQPPRGSGPRPPGRRPGAARLSM